MIQSRTVWTSFLTRTIDQNKKFKHKNSEKDNDEQWPFRINFDFLKFTSLTYANLKKQTFGVKVGLKVMGV